MGTRITKTRPYNFDPQTPLLNSKTGVYRGIYFSLFLPQNMDCGYSLELPRRVLTSTHNLCFEQKYEKYQNFLSENVHFLVEKFQYI